MIGETVLVVVAAGLTLIIVGYSTPGLVLLVLVAACVLLGLV